jgi:hypothetical protein
MCNNLENVFQEARADEMAVSLDGHGYDSMMYLGCKITKDKELGDVVIQNIALGGDYYKDISREEEKVFIDKGWRYGVYSLCVNTYKAKLDTIELGIKDEMNTKQNPKRIKHLKNHRERLLKNYNNINLKLNNHE